MKENLLPKDVKNITSAKLSKALRKSNEVFIYYRVYYNTSKGRWSNDNWELRYDFLNEEDVTMVACKYNTMKLKQLRKLIEHKSRLFNRMSTFTISVSKIFVLEPVEYISEDIQQKAWIKTMLEILKSDNG